MKNITAEIVAIGTEILLGALTDTNSVFIAKVLRDLGINVYFMTSVGDNEGRITDAIRIALSRADVVITCGGLGPTIDDMTRQAVATATGRALEFHEPLLESIAARFATFRAQMTENNRRQAYIPQGAIIVENPVGTAPCFIVEQGERAVMCLPGVPREMKFLLNDRLVPYLREHYQLGETVIKARVFRTAGIGESMLDEQIGRDLLEASNPTVGLNAHMGQVDMRVTAKANTQAEADAMITQVEVLLRQRVGRFIFGTDTDTIERVLIDELQAQGAHLAVVHAGIAPLIVERLHTAGGESCIARADQFTDVSGLEGEAGDIRAAAERAAQTTAADSGADIGIAIVSRAHGNVDQADSEALSAIAVWSAGSARSRSYGFGADADSAHEWLSLWALSMAWRMLRERTETPV